MHFAEERKHMMFAHAVKLNVADDDHVVAVLVEDCAVDHFVDILFVAARQELKAFADALRGFEQPFALRIFAKVEKYLADFIFNHVNTHFLSSRTVA